MQAREQIGRITKDDTPSTPLADHVTQIKTTLLAFWKQICLSSRWRNKGVVGLDWPTAYKCKEDGMTIISYGGQKTNPSHKGRGLENKNLTCKCEI